MNDAVLNKISIIERCVKRVEEVYENNPANISDYTKQDSMVLNIQRACEASIDLAMHLVSKHKLGLPQTSRDAFAILLEEGMLDRKLAVSLMNMVGFRSVAVHYYQSLDVNILESIIEKHMKDFLLFTQVIIELEQ
ncbi:MAG TPA: DUF86 domain-containing protein [Bacillota bacterium]|nr:DUF86 domain-containing protein [Bacillota bacterium]